MHLAKLALTEIFPPSHAVRAEIDEKLLMELTEDVRRNGVLVPPHVRQVKGGYEIVAGHRRYLAACAAQMVWLNCLVLEAEDGAPELTKFTENLYRQELSPVEEAGYFAELFELLGQDTDAVARKLGKTRGYIESRLLLLQGDGEVLRALARKSISLAVAQELNKMVAEEDRRYYLEWAVSQGATTKLVRFWREAANASRAHGAEVDTTAPAPVEPGEAAPDIFRCFLCGEKEPVYDLQVIHIHRGCRVIVERQAENAELPRRVGAESEG
jgi:ParB family transcriptional regulator, chromosome partitioning protein